MTTEIETVIDRELVENILYSLLHQCELAIPNNGLYDSIGQPVEVLDGMQAGVHGEEVFYIQNLDLVQRSVNFLVTRPSEDQKVDE